MGKQSESTPKFKVGDFVISSTSHSREYPPGHITEIICVLPRGGFPPDYQAIPPGSRVVGLYYEFELTLAETPFQKFVRETLDGSGDG